MAAQADRSDGNVNGDWNWIENTYWCVPDLPALNLAADRDTLS